MYKIHDYVIVNDYHVYQVGTSKSILLYLIFIN